MKKLFLVLILIPLISLGQSAYKSYYENGNLKVTGEGFTEEIKYKISAKSGLNLRESPELKSEKIAKVPYGTLVSIKSKTNLKLTISDTDKETGITKSIQGEWVKIAAEFFLGPGDKGYYVDLIERSIVEGYVFDGFLKEEKYLVHKPGVWTYYFESGVISEEVFYSQEGVVKKITYDTDGDINKIEEHQKDDLWGSDVRVTFYKNGKVKNITVSENGGADVINFDKNGNILDGGLGIYSEKIILSKDIRDFYFTHWELEKNRIELEQKPIVKLTEFKNGRWISTDDSLSGIEIKNRKWIMFYKGREHFSSIYDFKIRREFMLESGALYKPLEYLTLINDSGTLEYYIIEYNNELLSLSYIARGNTLNYKPENKTQ